MSNARRIVLLAAVLLAALPGSASARLMIEPAATAKFPQRTMVLTLPVKMPLAPGDIALRENGSLVDDLDVVPVSGSRRSGTVLAIDTSQSMAGDPIAGAMAAAREFAAHRPRGASLGVVFFSRVPRVELGLTTDDRRIDAALRGTPPLVRGTRVLDAAAAGVKLLAKAAVPAGTVVVLSDGADAGSATTMAALESISRRTRTRIFTVGLRSDTYNKAGLVGLARAGRGEYVEARRAGDLPSVFGELGDRLSREYLVSYRSTEPLNTNVLVDARVSGISGRALTTYDSPNFPGQVVARPKAVSDGGLSNALIGLLAAGSALLAGLIVFVVLTPRRRTVVSRIGEFAGAGPSALAVAAADEGSRAERAPSARWQRIAEQLELADIQVEARRFVAAVAGACVFLLWIGIAAGNPLLLLLALAVPIGARQLVRVRIRRRRRKFDDQLPDNLQLLASALRAGQSFSGALMTMVDGAPEPSSGELRRAATDEQLGVPVDEAMAGVARRMANDEIEYIGIVAQQQRESGGNTAEILDRVGATIRERQQLRREIQTLTAQGRAGGGVVSALPFALFAAVSLLNPDYMDPLLNTGGGRLVLIAAVLLMIGGWFAIRKIVDIKV